MPRFADPDTDPAWRGDDDTDLYPGAWVSWTFGSDGRTRYGVIEAADSRPTVVGIHGTGQLWLIRNADGCWLIATSRLTREPDIDHRPHAEVCLCPRCVPAGGAA